MEGSRTFKRLLQSWLGKEKKKDSISWLLLQWQWPSRNQVLQPSPEITHANGASLTQLLPSHFPDLCTQRAKLQVPKGLGNKGPHEGKFYRQSGAFVKFKYTEMAI